MPSRWWNLSLACGGLLVWGSVLVTSHVFVLEPWIEQLGGAIGLGALILLMYEVMR